MRIKTARQFHTYYKLQFASGDLTGESAVEDLKEVGDMVASRLHSMNIYTVNDLLHALCARRSTAASVFDKLTRFVQNLRAGQRIEWKNSPLARGRSVRNYAVVADFRQLSYISLRALMVVVSAMRSSQRRRHGITIAVKRDLIPPLHTSLTTNSPARHCSAYHDQERSCRANPDHCQWVPASDRSPSHCIPKEVGTKLPAGVGANVRATNSTRRTGHDRASPPPVRGDHDGLEQTGQYVQNIRIPGPLEEVPLR